MASSTKLRLDRQDNCALLSHRQCHNRLAGTGAHHDQTTIALFWRWAYGYGTGCKAELAP